MKPTLRMAVMKAKITNMATIAFAVFASKTNSEISVITNTLFSKNY
jgi:hypothetical protein